MKSYFDFGINVSSHTDYPALTGSPEELLNREQALTALTINVARQLFVENERGSITTGKYADFILVDKDVLTCPVRQIHMAKTAATYFEGKKVY